MSLSSFKEPMSLPHLTPSFSNSLFLGKKCFCSANRKLITFQYHLIPLSYSWYFSKRNTYICVSQGCNFTVTVIEKNTIEPDSSLP